MRLGRCDGIGVKSARIQRLCEPADIAAFSCGIPALVADNEGDFLAIYYVVELTDILLQFFELFFVGFVVKESARVAFVERGKRVGQGKSLLVGRRIEFAVFY